MAQLSSWYPQLRKRRGVWRIYVIGCEYRPLGAIFELYA